MAKKEQPAIRLPENVSTEKLLEKVAKEREIAFKFQKRRHDQWLENYLLYRDRVKTNRLTQRNAINIPIIKETIRTILPKIDEEPYIIFEDKGGDLDKEIIIQAKWQEDFDNSLLPLLDVIDKKQVLIYGRSAKKINIDAKGNTIFELKDPYDFLIDKDANPIDIETARYLCEQNIMKPLEYIINNENYDKDGRQKIKEVANGSDQSKQTDSNRKYIEARNERLKGMGVTNTEDFNYYGNIQNLTQHYTTLWDEKKKKFVRYVVLTAADDTILLRAIPLIDAMGVDFWPFESWADDLEISDIWTDSIADLLRTPNLVMNIWLSQYIENRTLRNFGMNFYDSTAKEGWKPDKMSPVPFGWYPLPGKPGEVYQKVDIPELSGTLDDIQFLINIAEKASATGAIEKGVIERAKRTLGEIEIAVGKAEQRTTSMSKFYRYSWKRFVEKWYAISEANAIESQKLYKKAPDGRLVGKEVKKDDWVSKEGYKITVSNENDKTSDKIDKIQRLMAVKAEYPNNEALRKAIRKRLISLADLTPAEAQEIETYEEKMSVNQMQGIGEQLATETAINPANITIGQQQPATNQQQYA